MDWVLVILFIIIAIVQAVLKAKVEKKSSTEEDDELWSSESGSNYDESDYEDAGSEVQDVPSVFCRPSEPAEETPFDEQPVNRNVFIEKIFVENEAAAAAPAASVPEPPVNPPVPIHKLKRASAVKKSSVARRRESREVKGVSDVTGCLLDRRCLKKAFIMSEILAPPLALRDPDHAWKDDDYI